MKGRRDANEAAIVQALEAAGCDVHPIEREPFDLVVGRAGQAFLLEVKGDRGGLTEAQLKFEASWRGHFRVVRTPQQALVAVGLMAG